MANKMYHYVLGSPFIAQDGTQHQVVNFSNLNSFQTEAVNNINNLIDHVNALHTKTQRFEKAIAFADWVAEVYPEIIDNYKTSERVAKRMNDGIPQEVCESAS